MKQLWISVYLPTHCLDLCFPSWATEALPAAVLEQGRVLACTPSARAQGVQPGMRAGAAQAMVPGLLTAPDDPAARRRSLHDIALDLLQYTPNVVCYQDSAVLLEVSASLSLFHGPHNLCRLLRRSLAQPGLTRPGLTRLDPAVPRVQTCLGMAPTALGAWVLASQVPRTGYAGANLTGPRQAGPGHARPGHARPGRVRQRRVRQRRVCTLAALQRLLDPLAVHCLPAAAPYADWLSGIGCHTLAQLRRLPRAGLQRRSSPLLLQELDAAYGRAEGHFSWFQAPPLFSRRHDLLERLEHSTAIQAVGRRLIEQLCDWLEARKLSVHGLDLLLHHEKGRHARPPTRIALRLSQAAWLPADFMDVLREQLAQLVLAAPVIALELSIDHAGPRPPANASLIPEPGQWQRDEHRMLDILRARLGQDGVRAPRPVASHLPEQANAWACAADAGTPAPSSLPPTLGPHARPLWLLHQPLALQTQNHRPLHNGRALRLLAGPERLETGWWQPRGHTQRDYFIAQDMGGVRYWVYQEREKTAGGWFLHGLFA